MTDQVENKSTKLDIISALQMKNTQENIKKNEVEDLSDGWSDYSDDEDFGGKTTQSQNTNKNDSTSKMVAKVDVKSKKYNNLKDYLGNEATGNNQNNKFSHGHNNHGHHYKKKQGGNFYKEGSNYRDSKKEFSKPTFVNPGKDFDFSGGLDTQANPEIDNIINNNSEYSQRNYQTGTHNNYGNTQRRYHNNFRSNYNNHRNPNGNYRKHDPKEDVLNTIKNFGKVLNDINEENKTLKDSTKGYNFSTEKVPYSNRESTAYDHKPAIKNDLQKPLFVNSSLENRPNNFKELEQSGDPYLRKIQEQGEETQYYQKRNPKNVSQNTLTSEKEPEEKTESNQEEIPQEKIQSQEQIESTPVSEGYSENPSYNKYYKPYKKNFYYNEDEAIWNKVVSGNNEGNYNTHNYYYQQEDYGNSDNFQKPSSSETNEIKTFGNKNFEGEYNNSKGRHSKRNSFVNNGEDVKKKIITKDKVVITTGNLKSIKDIFG